ncbi:MAG: DUF2189 domain-containing protein [Phyllobacteriaceae bacterium]|nr:DUF2189 domain-containing protein [Phyllobacteriaceae bacterium]
MTDIPGSHSPSPAAAQPAPVVRDVGAGDVVAALRLGLADFLATPAYGLFFGGIYALGGLFLLWLTIGAGVGYLTYPLATGFAILGPFVAVGCYEVSRRRERGERLDFLGVLGVIGRQSSRELGWMAFVTLFVFLLWMYQVRVLLILTLGFQNFTTFADFLRVATTTREGWLFLALVHADGLVFALVAFSLTVVSFPLLLEREIDFVTAMITSVKAVTHNPKTMIAWGLIVAGLLFAATLPAFLGLFVVLPVLGHATWHLHHRLVEPAVAER